MRELVKEFTLEERKANAFKAVFSCGYIFCRLITIERELFSKYKLLLPANILTNKHMEISGFLELHKKGLRYARELYTLCRSSISNRWSLVRIIHFNRRLIKSNQSNTFLLDAFYLSIL